MRLRFVTATVAAASIAGLAFVFPAVPAPPDAAPPATDELSAAFEKVADAISPSVVTVSTVRQLQAPDGLEVPRFFFGLPFGDSPGEGFDQFQRPRERVQQGQGSGVIVSADGYVLTNSHVVEGADEVTVTLPGGRSYTAKVVGTDPLSDLAVVKIEAEGLRPATLGDSDEIRVGQWVVAAGNPFGLTSTITAGIVSGKGRSRMGVTDYEDFIQTDAAINPGNSGGPLVNLRGEVVGINTAILSRTGGNLGIGFAIPINLARSVMSDLIEKGRVVRGWLGVVIQGLDEGLAGSFGYQGTEGALVADVTKDSPAERAGLRPGDIITRYGDRPVTDIDRLKLDVASAEPGAEVPVEVFRDGRRQTLTARIGELPGRQTETTSAAAADAALGMSVRTLTPAIAARLGLEDGVAGVVVTEVEPLGPAARAGLRPGDVITSVENDLVADEGDFVSALRRHTVDDGVRLTVRRGELRHFVWLQRR